MRAGKIYIFRNPYLQDAIVKIGKTRRTSEARSKEISAGTGVPYSFEVLFEEDVEDCDLAEVIIHERLQRHRINPRREFFELPLKDAVKTVFLVCMELNQRLHGEVEARVLITLRPRFKSDFAAKLKALIESYRGGDVRVCVVYKSDSAVAILPLGDEWRINIRPALLRRLRSLKDVDEVEILTAEYDVPSSPRDFELDDEHIDDDIPF